MSLKDGKQELAAKLLIWTASRASRNKNPLDRACRRFIAWVTKEDPENNFMRDPIIDEDDGFDPDELDAYQRGETDNTTYN